MVDNSITTRPGFRLRLVWIATGLLILTGLAIFIGFHPVDHVKVEDVTTGQQSRSAWVYLDYVTSHDKAGHFEGVVQKPASGVLWLDNTTGAMATFTVNGKQVYQGTDSYRLVLDNNAPVVLPFSIDYQLTKPFPGDGHLALMQEGLFGS